jgi:hypothetical protein
MTVRMKLNCTVVRDYGTWKEVEFSALYSSNPEDNTFSLATPSAKLVMTVTNPNVVYVPGQSYFFDSNPVPKPVGTGG